GEIGREVAVDGDARGAEHETRVGVAVGNGGDTAQYARRQLPAEFHPLFPRNSSANRYLTRTSPSRRERRAAPGGGPLRRRRAHVELEHPAGLNVAPGDEWRGERLAVEARGLNVEIGGGVVRRSHYEAPSAGQRERDAAEQRAADHVVARGGIERIEAHGGEDVPGGHLAAVLVAGDPVGRIGIIVAGDLAHACLRLPRLAAEIVQVAVVMAGLIVVVVMIAAEVL